MIHDVQRLTSDDGLFAVERTGTFDGTGAGLSAKRFAVVINPRGGKQRGSCVFDLVKPILTADGASLDVHVTQQRGHATSLAETLELKGYDGLCVIGGDGTVHEVANGLMNRRDGVTIPLGLIPAGTGNALHQHLGFRDPLDAAKRIAAGKTQPFDVAKVTLNDRVIYCMNIVGWGAVADINGTAEKMRSIGSIRYTLAALWHILHARRRRIRLMYSGQTIDDEFLFVIGCNTKYTGAGMKLAPAADPTDGKIDLLIVKQASPWQMLTLFRKVYDGSHLSLDLIEHHQVDSFRIESSGDDVLNLDGELTGHSPFSVDMIPGALQVFT